MIEGVALSALWKLMSWLPGIVLRRFISKESLVSKTRIDVRPRHDPVQLRGGEIPEATVWLQVSNNGYFQIELDRLTAELSLAGAIIQLFSLDRIPILPGATQEVLLRGALAPGHIAHFALNRNNGNSSLQVRAEFNSNIHNFSVRTDHLSGITPTTVGF